MAAKVTSIMIKKKAASRTRLRGVKVGLTIRIGGILTKEIK